MTARGRRVCVCVWECASGSVLVCACRTIMPIVQVAQLLCHFFPLFAFYFFSILFYLHTIFVCFLFFVFFFFYTFFCSSGIAIIFIHLFRHLMSCQCLDNASFHFFAPAPSPLSFFCSLSFRWKISMSSAARWAFSLHCCHIRMS